MAASDSVHGAGMSGPTTTRLLGLLLLLVFPGAGMSAAASSSASSGIPGVQLQHTNGQYQQRADGGVYGSNISGGAGIVVDIRQQQQQQQQHQAASRVENGGFTAAGRRAIRYRNSQNFLRNSRNNNNNNNNNGNTNSNSRYAHSNRPQSEDEAITRLSKVFGIDRVPAHRHNRSPPQYMVDLYNAVAYRNGITRTPSPYGSDVVRGFPDRASREHMIFTFNVSYIAHKEKVLAGEFHVFRLRARPPETGNTLPRGVHLVELRLYQILNPRLIYRSESLKLLDFRRVSTQTHGWEVFKVKDTIQEWVNDSARNHGFLIEATTLGGTHAVNGSYLRLAQRSQHHDSKQPVLVAFTEDNQHLNFLEDAGSDLLPDEDRRTARTRTSAYHNTYIQFLNERHRAKHGNYRVFPTSAKTYRPPRGQSREQSENTRSRSRNKRHTEDFNELAEDLQFSDKSTYSRSKRSLKSYWYTDFDPEPGSQDDLAQQMDDVDLLQTSRSRSRRSVEFYHNTPRRRKETCSRHELYVDFDEIGWSGWIISPKGYNAYHCKGECPFPLGQNQKPTNHATVQSIVHALRIGRDVGTPCCVPNKLYSFSLLYFDDDENVILKRYDDMVAASCGCH